MIFQKDRAGGGVRISATPPLIFRLQIYRIQAKRASISVAAHKIFIAHNKDKQSTKEAAKLADLTTLGDGAMKRLHFNNYPISLTLLSILLPEPAGDPAHWWQQVTGAPIMTKGQ